MPKRNAQAKRSSSSSHSSASRTKSASPVAPRKDDRLWGGRFDRQPDEHFDQFQRSFSFDRRLLPYEIVVDRAWAKALEPITIFTATEVRQTLAALDKISARAQSDPAWVDSFGATAEDVHHFVEKALVEELGPLGWKLHTGRSRNELIATDFRLFVIDAAAEIQRALAALINTLLMQAKAKLGVPMAGMTHMQHAQPILLSHFLLAHAEAFTRDITRLQHAAASADACPMGSGALAGNSFAIDRHFIARELGFSKITANSLDAVSDRDFALDYLFALTGISTHLSRLAEDFVLFASQEFSYVILPDEYSTGSSLMPQKKNPDSWELIRGKSGRITGALVSLLTTLKGLPTSYQRDLQEDKEALFAAHDQVADMILVATGAIAGTQFREDRLRASASNPVLFATEGADYLVRKGIPFRQAHDLIGQVLREAEKQNVAWTALPLVTLKKTSPAFDSDFIGGASTESAIATKIVPGGTALQSVRAALATLQNRLQQLTSPPGAKS
jgi:argininosuccinate lyase